MSANNQTNKTNATHAQKMKTSYCHEQIQGMDYNFLPRNTPTVSDTPWAVNGSHRNDFGSAERVCVMLTGGACLDINPTDKNPRPKYETCRARCWGSNMKANPKPKVRFNDTYSNYDPLYSVWEYSKGSQDPNGNPDDLKYQPQVACASHSTHCPSGRMVVNELRLIALVFWFVICRVRRTQSLVPDRGVGKMDQWKKLHSIALMAWPLTRKATFTSQTRTIM